MSWNPTPPNPNHNSNPNYSLIMPTPLPLAPLTPGEEDPPHTRMLRMMLVVTYNDDDVSFPHCGLPPSCPPHRIMASPHGVLPIVSFSLCPP